MSRLAMESGEIQIIGKRTREWIVAAETCPLLRGHRISAVGISEALPDFRFVRNKPEMSVVMACGAGRGLALVEGESRNFQRGMAYLMPPRVRHGYEAAGRAAWRVCWVCYVQPVDQTPVISAEEPRLVRADTVPLEAAIRGLYRETMGPGAAGIQKLYVELVHEHSLRIARHAHAPDRLWKLWTRVEANLARGWTLEGLAREGGMSVELLRMLSHQSNGRSPMKHLTFLRMQSAAVTLASTGMKVSAVAETVGYGDPFAFSVAFKRHVGMAPGAYRARKRSVSIH